MSYLIKDILPNQFKHYVKASRSCRFSSTCVIGSRFGAMSLEFGDSPETNRCVVTFRRRSGNGKVILISGKNSIEDNIISKKSQYLSIVLNNAKELDIKRTAQSMGDIDLLKIQLYSDIQQVYTAKDWRSVLSKCISYSFIRIVEDELFASEGALIKTLGINGISTNPPNMYRVNNNTIRFPSSCQILTLDVMGDYSTIILPDDISKAEHSTMCVVPKVLTPVSSLSEPMEGSVISVQPDIPMVDFDDTNILFDSNKSKDLISIVRDGKFISDSNSFLLLRKGRVEVELPSLKSNREYVIVLEASKTGGNGKVTAYISPSRGRADVVFSLKNQRAITISSYSGDRKGGKPFKLIIERPESSTGEILVSRILLVYGLQLAKLVTDNFNYASVSFTRPTEPPVVNRYNIEYISKSFATIPIAKYNSANIFHDLKGIIYPVTHSANAWISKIIPLIPNVTISSMMLDNTMIINRDPDLIISCLGRLKPCKRIWLEEFQGEVLSSDDWDHLKNAEKVFSSSLPNVQYLSSELGSVKVDYLPKVWAYTSPTRVNGLPKKYVVYFNRNHNFTDGLFNAYDFSKLPMVILGARGAYPKAAAFFSNYVEYSKLLFILQNASCIIDLPTCNHYMSAILDFALISGVPIVTTNHWLSIGKPAGKFISSKLLHGSLQPNYHEINAAVAEAITQKLKPEFDMTSYNLNLYSTLRTALGIL